MPRKSRELTAIEVSRLKQPGLHSIGGVAGLQMQITAAGARTWVLRVMIGGKRRDMGLGGFPDVPLADARRRAREARDRIEQGIDPIEQRREAKSLLMASRASIKTFAECVSGMIAARESEWRNAKHRAQWLSTLETYAGPVIGPLRVSDVAMPHIVEILQPIWKTKTETAMRLRGRIEAVLDWARVSGYRTGENPARWKGHLDHVLPKPSKITTVEHHTALDVDAVAEFISALRQIGGMGAKALEFAIYTAARSGEVRGARWSEINLAEAVWTVPGERMKAGKEHRVPLSKQALAVLTSLPQAKGKTLVFQAPRGGMLSDMSMTAVLRRMKIDAVPHGFRSTFRDWAAERTNFPRELAEKALAHMLDNKTEAAYQRSDMFAKRAGMMAAWGTFCETPMKSAKVTPLRRRAA